MMLARLILAAALVLAAAAATAQTLPRAPCAGDPYPRQAGPDQPPTLQVWREGDHPAGWSPATCGAWPEEPARLVASLSGSFRFSGKRDALVERFGSISTLAGIRYWSVTRGVWRTLVTGAQALTAADGVPRPDFAADELKSGEPLFYSQRDSGATGSVVYRMRLVTLASDRFVIAVDNVSVVSFTVLTLFPPGTLRSLYVIERDEPEVWRFYSLALAGSGASMVVERNPASFANRSVAFYRHLVGIPTDQEPPAFR